MATLDLGKIKQVWRGTYSNSNTYAVDDLAAYTDSGITSTYIAIAASSNSNQQVPSTSGTATANYWEYVAKGVVDPIPTQNSGTNGKFLTSNGSSLSFAVAGGLLQAKQWIKQSTLFNDTNADSVMGAPFDGSASITPSVAGNLIKATYFTTHDHGTTWRAGYQRLQWSSDGGSNYYGLCGGSSQSYIEGNHGTGNMISLACMFNPNTTNAVKVRVVNNSHASGNAGRWGQYNNEDGSTSSNVTPPTDNGVVAVGHGLLLEEIDSSVGSITTIS